MKQEIYTTEQNKREPEDLSPELQEKVKKAEKELTILAQVVGGDFDMSVKFGRPGQGSFFNSKECSITLNPLIIQENKKWQAEFIAGHEGGHRAITRDLEQIGVKEDKALEIYDQIGYGYLDNCVEDCADNNWVGNVFEKFKQSCDKNYQEQFSGQNTEMTTPEIQKISAMLGYTPRFVSFGSEILRQWAIGEYSEELDKEVEKALKKTKKDCQKAWQEIPRKHAKEDERLEKAKQRFRIIYEKVWPEFEKIVKMDIDQEKTRQLANEMLKQSQKQQKGQGRGSEGQSSMPGLPKQMQDELEKATKENFKKQLEEMEKQIKELEKELKKADSQEKEKKIKGKIKKKMAEKQDMENGEKNLVPWDELSDEVKEKLKQIYNKLPKDLRDELEDKAEKTLEEVDDELIKQGRGKLAEKAFPLTHEEAQELNEQAEEQKTKQKAEQQEAEQQKKLRKELEKTIEGNLSEYDQVYKEVAPLADKLYKRIYKIFLPHRHPRWEKGHPTGHRLDLAKVMQFQADKSLYDKLWERKTIPRQQDYRISLLVDLSRSMAGENIEKTFRAVVVVAEVLNRLGIKTEINGFQDDLIPYKNFDQDLSPEIRQKMVVMRKEVADQGIHNMAGYNSDGYCLKQVSENLQKNKAKDNFLLVFSDGIPVPDPAHRGSEFNLKTVVDIIRKKTKQKLIGLGVGPETEHVANYYPTSLPNLELKDLPELLGELLEDIIKSPAKYK